jgi:hypothetical protein
MTASAYTERPCGALWTTSSASLAGHACWASSMSELLWAVR